MRFGKVAFRLAIVAHALGMLFFTFYLMRLPWLAGDEKLLIWSTSLFQLVNREPPPPEEFALVNTSYDLKLIDRIDANGFPVGQQVITDREKLARLVEILASGPKKPAYVIMDIHFADTSSDDQRLREAFSRLPNTMVSAHLNDDDQFEAPVFKEVGTGLSDYVTASVFEGVYKYQLVFRDTMLLTPLKVHAALTKQPVKAVGPFVKVGDRWMLNHFILNFRLLQKDLVDDKADFNPVNLGELLSLPEDEIRSFAAGKILVLGDLLENDMHQTLFEVTAGPVILLNAYLSIREGDTALGVMFLLLLFGVYLFLSHRVFNQQDFLTGRGQFKWRGFELVLPTDGFMGYLSVLVLLSLFTFFLYNVHLNVFFLACAFYASAWTVEVAYGRKWLLR